MITGFDGHNAERPPYGHSGFNCVPTRKEVAGAATMCCAIGDIARLCVEAANTNGRTTKRLPSESCREIDGIARLCIPKHGGTLTDKVGDNLNALQEWVRTLEVEQDRAMEDMLCKANSTRVVWDTILRSV